MQHYLKLFAYALCLPYCRFSSVHWSHVNMLHKAGHRKYRRAPSVPRYPQLVTLRSITNNGYVNFYRKLECFELKWTLSGFESLLWNFRFSFGRPQGCCFCTPVMSQLSCYAVPRSKSYCSILFISAASYTIDGNEAIFSQLAQHGHNENYSLLRVSWG